MVEMIKNKSVAKLNLARKWRSKQFSTIIGQDLVVRILKNSLYASSFFPVYLFSGTRGCGKTTTARVFAMAINCENLENFQKNPTKVEIPCLECKSCVLMQESKHPDFIEMDAASHTGVDNVRDIIEAASLLPTVGKKRIYLIDEAHMLSKAAFNAFLKILEEPPSSVLFILATTERQKVIETVKSRCFQLFFQAVSKNVLVSHLKNVCDSEGILYEDEGLELVTREAAGSVRDALNVLERVRFSVEKVSRKAVLANLQHIDDSLLLELIEYACRGDRSEIIRLFEKTQLEKYGQTILWQKIISILQSIIWSTYGVARSDFIDEQAYIKKLAEAYSVDIFIYMLEKMYQHEQIFLRTTAQSTLIQILLLGLCKNKSENNHSDSKKYVQNLEAQEAKAVNSSSGSPSIQGLSNQKISTQSKSDSIVPSDERWVKFLHQIEGKLEDPLANSIVRQAYFVSFDTSGLVVSLSLSKKLSFFKDSFVEAQKIWQPILSEVFTGVASKKVSCELLFNQEQSTNTTSVSNTIELNNLEANRLSKNQVVNKSANETRFLSQSSPRFFEKKTSSSIAAGPSRQHLKNGKNARALLQYFPGSLSVVRHENE